MSLEETLVFNLITTLLICLGMSYSDMPISNYKDTKKTEIKATLETPKYENQVNTYSLNLTAQSFIDNQTATSSAWTTKYRKREYSGHNNYINVIGTYYYNDTIYNGTNWHVISNRSTNLTDNVYQFNNNYEETCKSIYVFQVNGYNFNINENIRLRISFSIWDTTDAGGYVLNGQPYYFKTITQNVRVYQSLDSNFASYIGMQNNLNNAINIEDDIRNINNGYYYDYNEFNIDRQASSIQSEQIDINQEFSITGNANNYIVMVIQPMVELDQEKYGNQAIYEELVEQTNVACIVSGNTGYIQRPYGTASAYITGTNIIPTDSYEVVDIPGLMFDIVGLPFTFISSAFNLTLFPNTPYQINISNLFLAVIGLMIFIFLMSILIRLIPKG